MLQTALIGRKAEQQVLEEALLSKKPELVSLIGRRRVGKTYLVERYYDDKIVFQIIGIENAPKAIQLKNFTAQLSTFIKKRMPLPLPIQVPSDWFDAILLLIDYLEQLPKEEKIVVFWDELPWLATHKSGFLNAFSYFWNSWAKNQNIVVVICGSAAAWMIQKVVHHKGSLHNRITKRIDLKPFTLKETEAYLQSQHIHFERYHILQLYMAMGGIPHYLEEVKGGISAIQNIEQICFAPTGLLRDEFSKLYHSLFKNADHHIAIIRVLAKKRQGLTRQQIVQQSGFQEGGTLQKILRELEYSGFISIYRPFGKKKKERLYRLTDEYSLFYLQFIEGKAYEGGALWQHLSQTQTYKTWTGYAFESICMKHLVQIKQALGISGIYSLSASFYKKGTTTEAGAQIDLLIDRNDQTINLFEIKFYNEPYTLTKKYVENLRNKMSVFRQTTHTRKQLFWVFITTFGVHVNQYSLGTIAKVLMIEDLFE